MSAPVRRGTSLPLVPDEALSPATTEPEEIVFVPEKRHHKAVDAFMETHSMKDVQAALGTTSVQGAYSFTRRTWFLEEIRKRGFVPIAPAELGASVAVAAGLKALEHLEGDEVTVDSIKKLGDLGAKLMGATDGGAKVTIGTLQQLDMRGLTVEEMKDLLGGSAAVAAGDVIDTDWTSG